MAARRKSAPMTTLDAALALLRAGLSVIPVVPGTKRPAVPWSIYQKRLPTEEELARWFPPDAVTPNSVGVVTGTVSGGLEVMDFDDEAAFQAFKDVVNTIDADANAIAARCPVSRTPSGGYHVYYRFVTGKGEPFPGNSVFARDADKRVRIETRGEGGYAQVAPSPGYEIKHLSLTDIPTLTREERDRLVSLARTYNQYVEPYERFTVPDSAQGDPEKDGLRPGDDFNDRGEISDLLKEAGWRIVGHRNGVTYWQRPGKEGTSPSATQGVGGANVFYVFSSNAPPFVANTAYSYFAVYALLKHKGDFKAAAEDLQEQGYGRPGTGGGVTMELERDFPAILPITHFTLPAFPSGVYPAWLEEYVNAVALSTQTPSDLAALLSLAALATCLAKRIQIAPREDWREPVNIYTVCALPSGTRKTAVFKMMTHPLFEYEREVNRARRADLLAAESERVVLEQVISRVRAEAAKAPEELRPEYTEKLRELARQQQELEERAAKPFQMLADDVTPEKLANLLAQNGGRFAILSDDTNIFDMMAGKYNGGVANLDVYLKGHSGGDLKVGRIGRDTDVVERPALTLGLAVQPEMLQGLMRKPGFRGRGLLGRWLYSYPEARVGWREMIDVPYVQPELIAVYRGNIRRLAALGPTCDDFGNATEETLTFERVAREKFWYWAQTIETRQRPGADLEDMKDWASKLHGLVARISALLHVAWHIDHDAPWTLPIDVNTLDRALRLGQYAVHHAKVAFAEMGADDTLNRSRRVLEWLRRSERALFTRRDVQRALPTVFVRAQELDQPLKLLTERGYIRHVVVGPKNGPGRRASERYETNPRLWECGGTREGVSQAPFEEVCATDPLLEWEGA